jgi:hypothetical protein
MSTAPTRESLLALYRSGTLVDAIVDRFDGPSEENITAAISISVELHNAGIIDLLSLSESGPMKTLPAHRFFTAQHFFTKAIPHLNAATPAMLSAVERLVAQGGEDLASTWPNGALREWLKQDPARAREVIAAAEADSELDKRHLVFALEALGDRDVARVLAARFADERRLTAITALGRMTHDEKAAGVTIELFQQLLTQDGPDRDHLCASLCLATVTLLSANETLIRDDTVAFLDRILDDAGEATQFQAARALWSNDRAYRCPELARALLKPLSKVHPAHKGTLRELDSALSHVFDKGDAKIALDFVTDLLSAPDCEIELKELQSFMHALHGKPLMAPTIVRWLRIGAPALCEGAVRMLGDREDHDRPLELPNEALAMPGREQVFVCRKAIAYFFIHPVIAGSIVVGFLRAADRAALPALAELLFNPLLLNFGGDLVDYLSAIAETDAAYSHVQAALKRHKEYVEGLGVGGELRELWPTERQRQIERMRRADEAAETFKAAEKQSVILNFVKRSTLLYGKRSVSYIKDANDERRSFDMELGSTGFAIELPRMLTTDPVGLDYILRIYRVEKLAS